VDIPGYSFNPEPDMPQTAAPNPQADTNQAIAACGGNVRDAVNRILIVAS
jgi:hypothetical protein